MSRPSAKPADRGGFLAQHTTDCYRCGEPIVRNVSLIVYRKGHPIHIECAPGGDDD